MPVSLTSRYRGVPILETPGADGVARPAIGMRPHPSTSSEGSVFRHRVTRGETVEMIAWRYYGTSEAWWRIADANPRRFPHDLEPGETLAIPPADAMGRVARTRRF